MTKFIFDFFQTFFLVIRLSCRRGHFRFASAKLGAIFEMTKFFPNFFEQKLHFICYPTSMRACLLYTSDAADE